MQMDGNRKKLLGLIAAAVVVLVIAAAIRVNNTASNTGAGETAAETTAAWSTGAAETGDDGESVVFDIKIVQTNDIHSYIEENADGSNIGLDRVAGIISYARDNSDIALALDGGDMFHGRPLASLVKGESVARVAKLAGYDAMTAGNHDWNYGKDRLKELEGIIGFPIITGNVIDENGGVFLGEDRLIKEVTKDGETLTIGVFGVSDPEMANQTMAAYVEGLTFENQVEYAKQMAAELRDAGCDIVIAMSHTRTPAAVAEQVDGVDVWICGHEHVYLDESVSTPDGSVAYVSECGYRLQSVGLIDIQYEISADGAAAITDYNKTTIEYEASQEFDKVPEVTAMIEEVIAENADVMSQEIGSTTVALEGEWEAVRVSQTNLGNVITDAYLEMTGADIALEHSGGIRASVEPGAVTYGDIVAITPFGNNVVTKSITGRDILDCLETSIDIQIQNREALAKGDWDAWPKDAGNCVQVGGMKVVYDTSREKGQRVVSAEIGGEPLDETRAYTLATNAYAAQLSLYPAIAEAAEERQFRACEEALISFFQQGPEKIAASAADERYLEVTE